MPKRFRSLTGYNIGRKVVQQQLSNIDRRLLDAQRALFVPPTNITRYVDDRRIRRPPAYIPLQTTSTPAVFPSVFGLSDLYCWQFQSSNHLAAFNPQGVLEIDIALLDYLPTLTIISGDVLAINDNGTITIAWFAGGVANISRIDSLGNVLWTNVGIFATSLAVVPDGSTFAVEDTSNIVYRLDTSGTIVDSEGIPNLQEACASDSDGYLYIIVGASGNRRIQKRSSDLSTIIWTGDTPAGTVSYGGIDVDPVSGQLFARSLDSSTVIRVHLVDKNTGIQQSSFTVAKGSTHDVIRFTALNNEIYFSIRIAGVNTIYVYNSTGILQRTISVPSGLSNISGLTARRAY